MVEQLEDKRKTRGEEDKGYSNMIFVEIKKKKPEMSEKSVSSFYCKNSPHEKRQERSGGKKTDSETEKETGWEEIKEAGRREL